MLQQVHARLGFSAWDMLPMQPSTFSFSFFPVQSVLVDSHKGGSS